MSSSWASDRPSLPAPGDDASNDPFVTKTPIPPHHRYSTFDEELFAAGPGSSPTQARRALEAHLAETDRRLDEAGKLGTALVSQRKALAEQLQEIEKIQAEGELTPELKQRLVEIEKEYNDLARESARVFLPKQRVPSNETNPGSPYVPEGRSGRRSVSPSKFESQATGSPTKLSVPNRKTRNQPSNRVHDIEFAAEISTSLIAQVRNLQALLAERDEEVRGLQVEKSGLEIESENLEQRVKTLDESEHRYKEENWNLETRLQEINAKEKDAVDREKRLAQALAVSKAEKNAAQKELDEVKVSHSKLSEEYTAAVKHHDIELGTAKRSMVQGEGERSALQRKLEELTSQNSELAKAFSLQRGRAVDREPLSGMSEDDFDTANDQVTPDHSPPPSPTKGTPRHSMLETETMRSSLSHAQRTIQSQRGQLHREKTEKLELRRLIQDLRDDLEKTRTDGGSTQRRSRKVESKEFKKPARLLGSTRSSRQEILEDDPDWEEHQGGSPRTLSAQTSPIARQAGHVQTDNSDHFDTANEASESAFETANERATETEDFQTGNEGMSGSEDEDTETEDAARGFGRMKQTPSLPAGLAKPGNRTSFHSTASTSADEDDVSELKTPTATISSQRSRARLSRTSFRNSRQGSEEPLQSSPVSYGGSPSPSGTPQAGQSLFAELQDFGSDDESLGALTPSRRSTRSLTPGSIRRPVSPPPAMPALPKVSMTDSGVMTEPIKIDLASPAGASSSLRLLPIDETERPKSMESVVGPSAKRASTSWLSIREGETDFSRPVSTFSYSDAGAQYEPDMAKELARFPIPPTSPPQPPELTISAIVAETIEPREEVLTPSPVLCLSTIGSESVEPVTEADNPPPALSITGILAESVDPIVEPDVLPPTLTLSAINTETVAPIAEVEPVAVPVPVPYAPSMGISSIFSQGIEPVSEPEVAGPPPALLSMTSLQTQESEPREEGVAVVVPPALVISDIAMQDIRPVSEPEATPPALALSSHFSQNVDPMPEPELIAPTLQLSSIASEESTPVSPVVESLPPPHFGFSVIESIETQPISPRTPWRDAFILPRDREEASPFTDEQKPRTPQKKAFGLLPIGKPSESPPFIAEDETRQSPRETPDVETPESQRPFKEISSNSNARPLRKLALELETSDQSSQTSLTADVIEQMIVKTAPRSRPAHIKSASVDSVGSAGSTGTVQIHRSHESPGSLARGKGKAVDEDLFDANALRRPGSSGSGRLSVQSADAPPLPPNHREIIEAARTGSSSGAPGSMGPPLWPASAMKNRPRTPSQQRPLSAQSGLGTPTPRANRTGSTRGYADVHSPTRMGARSRQSSVSSFASELDSRFNMRPGEMGIDPAGFGPNTDPRMIQAITQTMIGEYLWKYTRKTGRGELSEKRHRRYFWVHPYTRTLYWSDRDPSTAGRAEHKAKSVPIEAVRVVTDDNPMPPGLHRKSLVIISTGRTIKFTCTTGQRHETWFNALSYLLLRTNNDAQQETEEMAENITREDVDEFNPQMGRRPANGTRPRPPPSLSSYNSRTTRNESPAENMTLSIPTLVPTASRNPSTNSRPNAGTFSKLSGYWRSNSSRTGMFSSLRGRAPSAQNVSIYEASEVHDSAEDLREIIERQDRESDRLENVRACCDGKHDVGSLDHHSRRGRGAHTHSHPGPSNLTTPMSSTRSRT